MLAAPRIAFVLVAALALAPAARPAVAATAKPATDVLQAYVEATGGRAALDAEHTVYVRGRVRSMGMTGTFEQWVQHPDRFLQRITLGPVRMRTGYDGRVGWRTDLDSKHVTLLDGK